MPTNSPTHSSFASDITYSLTLSEKRTFQTLTKEQGDTHADWTLYAALWEKRVGASVHKSEKVKVEKSLLQLSATSLEREET